MGQAGGVEGVGLLGRLHGKTDGAAVGVAGGFAVDGGGDAEVAGGAAVEIPVLVGHAGRNAQRAQQGVIKLAGFFQVGHTDHHMAEHRFCLRWVWGKGTEGW